MQEWFHMRKPLKYILMDIGKSNEENKKANLGNNIN